MTVRQLPHRHIRGLTRREVLQVGYSGFLGLGLSSALAGRWAAAAAVPSRGRARAVIFVFLTGAPSHQDMWDLKPEAPEGIRGEVRPIDTNVPGARIGPHPP